MLLKIFSVIGHQRTVKCISLYQYSICDTSMRLLCYMIISMEQHHLKLNMEILLAQLSGSDIKNDVVIYRG